jgi:galactonate dehydratase
VPHVSIALGPQLAAAIHTAAALPNCALCEYNPTVFDTANRYLKKPLQFKEAAYLVPGEPGLGADVCFDVLMRAACSFSTG